MRNKVNEKKIAQLLMYHLKAQKKRNTFGAIKVHIINSFISSGQHEFRCFST